MAAEKEREREGWLLNLFQENLLLSTIIFILFKV